MTMSPNGPAIKGGCVTRRKHRAGHGHVWPRDCHGARRVWRVFLPSGYKLSGVFVSRGSQSSLKVEKLSWCFRTVSVAKRSVAVGLVSEAEICHGCRSLIACSERIRVQLAFLSCLGSRILFAKTVTSQLTFIVRVRRSYLFLVSNL